MIIRSSQIASLDAQYDAGLPARLFRIAVTDYPAIPRENLQKIVERVIAMAQKAEIIEEQDMVMLLSVILKYAPLLRFKVYHSIFVRYLLAVHLDPKERLSFLDRQLDNRSLESK